MQALILKVGFAALLGTSMVGTFYTQMVRPRLARLSRPVVEAPKQQFQWNWLPAQSGGVVPFAAGKAGSGDQLLSTRERSWVGLQGEAFEAVAVGDAFELPAEFGRPAAATESLAQDEAAVAASDAAPPLVSPGGEEGQAAESPAPAGLFAADLLGAPAEPVAAAAAEHPGEQPASAASAAASLPESQAPAAGDPKTPDAPVALNITAVPEPVPAVLLASGLIALSIAGLIQQRRRG